MNFLKKPYKIRRYLTPEYTNGYYSIPYTEMTLKMDVQTLKDEVITMSDGSK